MIKHITIFLAIVILFNQKAYSQVIFLACQGTRQNNMNSENNTNETMVFKIDEMNNSMKIALPGAFDFVVELCASGYKCRFSNRYFWALNSKISVISNKIEQHEIFIDRKNGSYRQHYFGILPSYSEEGNCEPTTDPFLDNRKNKF